MLDFEFQLTPGANNGLGIHYPGTGDAAYTGMEIQILDSTHPKYKDLKDYQFHGSLYTLAPAKQGLLKPAGEWNQERVTVMGPTLKVELNGEIILRANLDDLSARIPDHQGVKRRAGHIGWLGHGDRVAFRNIHIAELPPVANDDGVKAAGFTKIFDGTTLNGWKHTPETTNWKAIQGILKHNGKPGPINDLWTEKSYGDFTLVCDWRWSGRGPMKIAAHRHARRFTKTDADRDRRTRQRHLSARQHEEPGQPLELDRRLRRSLRLPHRSGDARRGQSRRHPESPRRTARSASGTAP